MVCTWGRKVSGLGVALQLVPLNSVERPPSPVVTISSPLLWQAWDRLAASLALAAPGRLRRRETHQNTDVDPERSQLHQDLHFTLGETKEGGGDGTGRKWLPKYNV